MRYESYQYNSPFMGMGNNPVLLVDALGGSVGGTEWTDAAQADYMANQIDASDDIVADFNYLQYGNYGPAGGGGYTTPRMDNYYEQQAAFTENLIDNLKFFLYLRKQMEMEDQPSYATLLRPAGQPDEGIPPGTSPENGRIDLMKNNNPITGIFKKVKILNREGELLNLFDVIIPNSYGKSSPMGPYYKKKVTINGYDYLIYIAGNNVTFDKQYYDIAQIGFGYLDRFGKYRKTNKFNGGYYEGFYMTGYYRNYLIIIGARNDKAYNYLKSLY